MEAENATKYVWPKKNENGWRICSNDELQVIYRKPNIVTTITARRLEWAGHPGRMSDDRNIKEVFLGIPDGRIKAGRPKLRILDY